MAVQLQVEIDLHRREQRNHQYRCQPDRDQKFQQRETILVPRLQPGNEDFGSTASGSSRAMDVILSARAAKRSFGDVRSQAGAWERVAEPRPHSAVSDKAASINSCGSRM